ncbi:MAG: hypothetical protein KGQ42_09285 [Alphaproteobacteria bacterium]|nr:hypothetical protein [Alphaproteobacteria bacterium]
MNPILPALFIVAFAEADGQIACLSARIVDTVRSLRTIILSLTLISMTSLTLACFGAYEIQIMDPINTQTRTLILAVALLWAAISRFSPPNEYPLAEGTQNFIVTLRSYARAVLRSPASLLAFCLTLFAGADMAKVVGAALGSEMGMLAANIPPLLFPKHVQRRMSSIPIRILAGIALCSGGLYAALSALRLM